MNAAIITEDVVTSLERRFGKARQLGKGRVFTFGNALTCSVSYSKLLGGHKYFYAIPRTMLDPARELAQTRFGDFVLLICGSADKILVLPRVLMVEMLGARISGLIRGDRFKLPDHYVYPSEF